MAVEHIKHWNIGDVEVARIVEVDSFEDDVAVLLKDQTPELLKQHNWLLPNFATPEGKMKISFQCFAVRSQGKTIMIDTCIGADRERQFDVFSNLRTTFLTDLAAAGFSAETIDTVLCTHLHFDHVGWNTMLVDGRWVPTFPRARYLFSRTEFDHWMRLRKEGSTHHLGHLYDAIDPVVEAGLADFIPPDFHVTDEVSLFPTPGHTPGHVSVLIRSGAMEAVITGDMLHHPIQLVEPELQANFDEDVSQGALTRKTFVERFADTPTMIIGSHFCDPTSGWIVRDGKRCKLRIE